MQLITIFKYRAIPVPSEQEANTVQELSPEEPGGLTASTPAERFAARLSALAKECKAVQILQFPGFVLVGEIAGFAGIEQNVLPGILPPGVDLKGPQDKRGNRGH